MLEYFIQNNDICRDNILFLIQGIKKISGVHFKVSNVFAYMMPVGITFFLLGQDWKIDRHSYIVKESSRFNNLANILEQNFFKKHNS